MLVSDSTVFPLNIPVQIPQSIIGNKEFERVLFWFSERIRFFVAGYKGEYIKLYKHHSN